MQDNTHTALVPIAIEAYPPRPKTITIARPRGVRLGLEYWRGDLRHPGPMFPFEGNVYVKIIDATNNCPYVELHSQALESEGPIQRGRNEKVYDLINRGLSRLSQGYRDRADSASEGERRLLVEFEVAIDEIRRTLAALMPRYISLRTGEEGVLERPSREVQKVAG